MPANDPATILLSGLQWDVRREAIGSGVIRPGMLLAITAGVAAAHAAAAGATQKLFARRDISNAGSIDTTYASGDTVQYGQGRAGDIVNAILNAGTAITLDDDLISDGAGGVKSAAAETAEVFVGRALESVADPSSGFSRVKVELF